MFATELPQIALLWVGKLNGKDSDELFDACQRFNCPFEILETLISFPANFVVYVIEQLLFECQVTEAQSIL
jgi:hypothetical protein